MKTRHSPMKKHCSVAKQKDGGEEDRLFIFVLTYQGTEDEAV